jgi:CubicO group peptidase (beta-lactamase class C family)
MFDLNRRRFLATGVLLAAGAGFGAGSSALTTTETIYVCAPCGCTMDGVFFKRPGKCPACGMTLVAFDPKMAPRHPGPFDFDQCMQMHVAANKFSGAVLVARGPEVLFSKAYGYAQAEWKVPSTLAGRFRLGSLTKPFTATAVLQLAAAGALALDDYICKYINGCPSTWDSVKISQLLNHTSGIPDYMSLKSFRKASLTLRTHAQMVATFRSEPLLFKPGSEFSYSNSGYYLLGIIIENVTHKRYEEVLKENVFGPLALEDTGYDHADPIVPRRVAGYRLGPNGELRNALYVEMEQPFADGGLYSTSSDLMKFARSCDGSRLLSEQYRSLMETPGKGLYGYGWWITPAPGFHSGRQICHGGNINGFSAWLSRFPDEDIVLVVLSNLQETNSRQIALDLYSVLHQEPYEAPVAPAHPTSKS